MFGKELTHISSTYKWWKPLKKQNEADYKPVLIIASLKAGVYELIEAQFHFLALTECDAPTKLNDTMKVVCYIMEYYILDIECSLSTVVRDAGYQHLWRENCPTAASIDQAAGS